MRSDYRAATLHNLSARHGQRFLFVRGASTGDAALENALRSSGGNALHGAVAMCDQVNLYGAGLFSEGVHEAKRYIHFYDLQPGVATCTGSASAAPVSERARVREKRWVTDRLQTELLLHVLHAMGIINWVQT